MSTDVPTLLENRYQLLELIGNGGMADVYRARDEVLGREVAVKLLRQVEDPALRARFVAEAQLLAGLNHPGLVTLLDAGIRADRPYLVMTLADGPTLAAQIAGGPLPGPVVARIGTQLAEALAYAHQHGVVHRDVKPSNVLICEDARALLADFGIARLAGDLDQHTRTGETIGSPAYLSPEQAAGEPVSSAADVYSLGLVLLEALTGQRAYPGAPIEAAVRRLTAQPDLPLSLPRPWRDLLEAMTARDPGARPDAAEVAGRLAGISAGSPEAAPVVPSGDPTSTVAPGVLTGALATDGGALATGTLADGALATGAPLPHDPTSTRVLAVVEESPVRRATSRRRPWGWVVGVAVVAVVAVVVGALLLTRDPAPADDQGTVVPSDVPSRYQEPLQKLHDAVEGTR